MLDVWNSEGFVRHWSGDKERAGMSVILMVVGTPFIWLGGLREIQGDLKYVGKKDTDKYQKWWKILPSFVKW